MPGLTWRDNEHKGIMPCVRGWGGGPPKLTDRASKTKGLGRWAAARIAQRNEHLDSYVCAPRARCRAHTGELHSLRSYQVVVQQFVPFQRASTPT